MRIKGRRRKMRSMDEEYEEKWEEKENEKRGGRV
jgi:hypothetical protein